MIAQENSCQKNRHVTGMPEEEKKTALRERMREAVFRKPDAHCFEKPEAMTEYAGMNAIGG